MPIYTYHCKKCGHDFEEVKSLGGRKLSICPKCGGEAVITPKYIGDGVSFRFKGPGFYDTDYRI